MERKEFLKTCGQLCFGGIITGSVMSGCSGNYYAISSVSNNIISIKKSEFVELKEGVSKPRKFVMVRNDKLNFPIAIYKLNDNTYSALLMECTHKSCELNPNGQYLICPCHGSEFNNLGKVQNPPAETDLTTFKLTHDDESIYIYL